MKKLYIVDFKYYDTYESKDVNDRWTLACESREEVSTTMERNFEELKRYGYEPITYSFIEVSKTSNGFEVLIK